MNPTLAAQTSLILIAKMNDLIAHRQYGEATEKAKYLIRLAEPFADFKNHNWACEALAVGREVLLTCGL